MIKLSKDIILQVKELLELQSAPDFWENQSKAAEVNKQYSKLEMRLEPWRRVMRGISESQEILSIADDEMLEEITLKISEIEKDMISRGLQPEREFKVETPGGQKGSRAIDIIGRDPLTGEILEAHQVGRQT